MHIISPPDPLKSMSGAEPEERASSVKRSASAQSESKESLGRILKREFSVALDEDVDDSDVEIIPAPKKVKPALIDLTGED